ncbi:AraC family transcriptional regulator [Mediterraneibacter sp.]|jgi:AraC-like DNA-binding protein|uniref:AraC family transcriptional regulator n=1 Tax=Mediterraneibacter sp. TaxID=2316022 RepID=UPI0027B9D006|nr:AraC family transcriptional regulator [Mediterraneibacter sp.]
MWYQKDWFTGSDYYNLKEKQIHAEEIEIKKPVEQRFHEMTEIYYVKSGDADIWINGEQYQIQEGSFCCLYMHHFYRIERIRKPLRCVKVSFHIGLFMFLCFEQHKANENEMLMYGVSPLFFLDPEEKQRVLRILDDLLTEEREEKFLLNNMNIYLAMQLHALYCRYAMERKKKEDSKSDRVWDVIHRVLLDTSKTVPLEEYAKAVGMTAVTLNRKIVQRCGYTFFQLQKMGKVFNACALLHFPDLNIQYISDYLGFTSIEDFYRVFKRYTNVSVREYQRQNVGNGVQMHSEEEALQILIYLILNFHDPFQIKEMEKALKKKAYLIERRTNEVFGRSVLELLEEIRIRIACSYLVATDRTITQISSDVGFGSISSFQRSFFKYMNQTPSRFRSCMKSK